MKLNSRLLIVFLGLFHIMCTAQNEKSQSPFVARHPEHVQSYWYAGTGELNHFNLSQMRYGEKREGEAVLVYVTEDFLTEKQVKKESGNMPSVSVLKLNMMKKFVTGIYDYSIMTSIFTPMEYTKHPATLKSTFSSQDWCGQSFSQMNLKGRDLNYQTRSYFQNEGDTAISMEATYVEEDIWTRARIEPQMLPLGKINMVPSQEFLRLNHGELKPEKAQATLYLQVSDTEQNREIYIYTLTYPDLGRSIQLKIQSAFPFKILSWEEVLHADNPQKQQTTTATLTHSEHRPYWQENHVKDEALRDSLGLRYRIDK